MTRWFKCIIRDCHNTTGNSRQSSGKKVVFHKFPANLIRQQRILDHLRNNQKLSDTFVKVTDITRICSVHYNISDYANLESNKLRRDALPSLFPSITEEEPLIKRRRIEGNFSVNLIHI